MGYKDERRIIESRFKTLWADRTPVAYADVPYVASAIVPWVHLVGLPGGAEQASVGDPGSNLTRSAGVVTVRVHTPGGQGTDLVRELADHVCDIFRSVTVENIRFMIPYASDSSEQGSSWVSWTVFCPFSRDDFNS